MGIDFTGWNDSTPSHERSIDKFFEGLERRAQQAHARPYIDGFTRVEFSSKGTQRLPRRAEGSEAFFRWNIPVLTYAFDARFIQYFGLEGRVAVKEFL